VSLQTNVQLINYVDICSNALLSIIDNDNIEIIKTDDVYNINIDNDTKTLLKFYIESYCNNNYHYGKHNIIINTCRPYDNIRRDERGSAIKSTKYTLSEPDNFSIDKQKLEVFLDSCWSKLSKNLDKFVWISHDRLDVFDITCIIKDCLEPNPILINPTHYFFLRDSNNDYTHFNNLTSNFKTDIEILLRNSRIIY